ncbi:hypothetical protein JOC77_001085 [Peribacillus deserti]|uniref:Uncharacterized protein n=1 Tax=Peribacillus deserti TaxID=673318 RepID=A0ABS2QEW8_9BACI|nr:CBO0543 family protein [Peribacillus deserti]MBM7691678.1 hypothetical protein [Peribacillus deserti]
MHFIYNAMFLAAGIKWGDWKRWRDYYSTILFFIGGDLMKNFLLHDHPVWTYQETIFGESILRNHTIIVVMIMFVAYPATILMYLGRFPQERWKQFLWIAFWVVIYTGIEFVNLTYLDLINHHNGWNIGWSILFNIVMFSLLRLHFKNPLLAWALSIPWILFLWNVFDIPLYKLR